LILVTKYLGGQIKKNEMGGACGRYEGEGEVLAVFDGETCGKDTP
jgi:hypothetical protein